MHHLLPSQVIYPFVIQRDKKGKYRRVAVLQQKKEQIGPFWIIPISFYSSLVYFKMECNIFFWKEIFLDVVDRLLIYFTNLQLTHILRRHCYDFFILFGCWIFCLNWVCVCACMIVPETAPKWSNKRFSAVRMQKSIQILCECIMLVVALLLLFFCHFISHALCKTLPPPLSRCTHSVCCCFGGILFVRLIHSRFIIFGVCQPTVGRFCSIFMCHAVNVLWV